jgi:hypothetical protein
VNAEPLVIGGHANGSEMHDVVSKSAVLNAVSRGASLSGVNRRRSRPKTPEVERHLPRGSDINGWPDTIQGTCARAIHNFESAGNAFTHEEVDTQVVYSDTILAVFFANFNHSGNTFGLASTLGHSLT